MTTDGGLRAACACGMGSVQAKFFTTKTLQDRCRKRYSPDVSSDNVTKTVGSRLRRRPGRLFTFKDFDDLPASAVAPALSRLAARGEIRRARKGIYYLPRTTALGDVPPDPVVLGEAISRGRSHPAGLSAANLLGLTTQVPARIELVVEGKRPMSLGGIEFKPRMGTNRRDLHPRETALLEVLRDLGHLSDVSPAATKTRLLGVLHDGDARSRLLRAAIHEPPRVRAMVGVLAESAGAREDEVRRLRRTLNPTSKFDFGPLSTLPNAKPWGAR